MRHIQESIQRSIETMLGPEACDKCCQLVKRIRDSIMRYRGFLEESGELAEALYQREKQLLSCEG